MAMANKTGTPNKKELKCKTQSCEYFWHDNSIKVAMTLHRLWFSANISLSSFEESGEELHLIFMNFFTQKSFLLTDENFPSEYVLISASQRKVQKHHHYYRLAATIKHYAAGGGLILKQASFLLERLFSKVLSIPEACSQLSSNNNCLSAKSAQVCHKIFCQRPTVQFITSTS